jgi:ribonucleotide reductase beta subunit family protein with ferritin-like domain
MRYDYRNDYKGWNNERIEKHLPYLKDKLLQNIGICDSNSQDYLKRISYLENKIRK